MESTVATFNPRGLKTSVAMPAAITVAALVGDLASVPIAAIAHRAGVSPSFDPLQFTTYTAVIVAGVICGAIGWQLVRIRAANPSRLLARLVPFVLLLSFVPDITLGITRSEIDTTWGGVIALMAMHLVVAAAAVASYRYFLPVSPLDGRLRRDLEGGHSAV